MTEAIHPFFTGGFGYADDFRRTDPAKARTLDGALDAQLAASPAAAELIAFASARPPRDLLVVVPVHPALPFDPEPLLASLRPTRHRLHLAIDAADLPRTAKINRAAAAHLERGAPVDWLIVIDDDVALPPAFVDTFVAAAELAALVIAQPAHRRFSHASYRTTQREPGSLVRRTAFVEVGPVVAISAPLLTELLPLPETRSGWGADLLWSERALRRGCRIGVVDATPVEHLRPLRRQAFPAAMAEVGELLRRERFAATREELLGQGEVVLGW